jgi:excisionase family DNA binding protein
MKPHEPPTSIHQLISAHDVARQLSISVRKVWRLVSSSKLPAPVKVGERSTRFRQADIDAFVEALTAGR